MFNNEFISTGNKELDQRLNRGIAKSSLFSLIGKVGSNRTEFILNIIKHNKELNKDFNVLYVDTDDKLDKKHLKELGIDTIDILKSDPHEIQLNHIKSLLNSNVYDLIAIDSVNFLFTDYKSSTLLSNWLSKDIMPIINSKDNKTSIVIIEQIAELNSNEIKPFPIEILGNMFIRRYARQVLLLKKNEPKYKVIKNWT